MISILSPTRKRPAELKRMVLSAAATAKNPIEIVTYFDEDDTASAMVAAELNLKIVVGPRITLSATWDKCLPLATGDLVCQGNDDIVFRTPGWDVMVEREFDNCPDKILMVHGDDLGGCRAEFGPHPIVHRKWIEIVGYFIAPHYQSDFGDSGVNDVANALGRRRFLPFIVEHMHHAWGKAEKDQTTLERLANHDRQNPEKVYAEHLPERLEAIRRLREVMQA
jgi:hypothetical protein